MPQNETTETPNWLREAAAAIDDLASDDSSSPHVRAQLEQSKLGTLAAQASHRLATLRLRNLQETLADVEGIIDGLRQEVRRRKEENRSLKLTEEMLAEAERERARLLQAASTSIRVPGFIAGERHFFDAESSEDARESKTDVAITRHFSSFYRDFVNEPSRADVDEWQDHFYSVERQHIDPYLEETAAQLEPEILQIIEAKEKSNELPPKRPATPSKPRPVASFSLSKPKVEAPKKAGAPTSKSFSLGTPKAATPAKVSKASVKPLGFLSKNVPSALPKATKSPSVFKLATAAPRPVPSARAIKETETIELQDDLELAALEIQLAELPELDFESDLDGELSLDGLDIEDFDLDTLNFDELDLADDLSLDDELTLEDLEGIETTLEDDLLTPDSLAEVDLDTEDLELEDLELEDLAIDEALGLEDLALDEELLLQEDDLLNLELDEFELEEIQEQEESSSVDPVTETHSEPIETVAEIESELAELEAVADPLSELEELSEDDFDFESMGLEDIDLSDFELDDLDIDSLELDSDEIQQAMDAVQPAEIQEPVIEAVEPETQEPVIETIELVEVQEQDVQDPAEFELPSIEELETPELDLDILDVEEPVIEALEPEVTEEPAIEALEPEIIEEPAIEALEPEIIEEPAIEALEPEIIEEPAIEALEPEVPEEPAVEEFDILSVEEFDLPSIEDLETPELDLDLLDLEEPVIEALEPEVIEEPVIEALEPEVIEEPAIEALEPEVIEEPVIEALEPEVTEEPVIEALEPEVIEEPVIEALEPEVTEEPVIEALEQEIIEEPVIEALEPEVIEEPVIEALEPEVTEEPIIEALEPEVTEEPVIEALEQEIIEEPVIEALEPEVIEVPVIEALEPEVVEEPVIEALEPEVTEEPVIEALEPEVVEEPVIEALEPEVIEEPVIEALEPEIIEEPVIEALEPEIIEEPAIEALEPEIIEEPVIEALEPEIIEEPVIEALEPEIIEEPAIEALEPEIIEEPVIEALEQEIIEEPVIDLLEPSFEEPIIESLEPSVELPAIQIADDQDLFTGAADSSLASLDELFGGAAPSLDDLLGPADLPSADLVSAQVSDDLFATSGTTGELIETPDWLLEPLAELVSPSVTETPSVVAAEVPAEAPAKVEPAKPVYETGAVERRRLVRLSCDYAGSMYFEGRPIEGRILDISLGGMKIRVSPGPKAGQDVTVGNPMPDARTSDPVKAKIAWVRDARTGDGKVDVGLQFSEAPESLGRSWIIQVINKIGTQTRQINQRKYTRAIANLPVDIEINREKLKGTALDIGLGGALVATSRPFTPTTRFQMSVGPFGSHDVLDVRSEVVQSRRDEEKEEWQQSVKFIEMGPSQTKLLGKYVVDLLKSSGTVPNA